MIPDKVRCAFHRHAMFIWHRIITAASCFWKRSKICCSRVRKCPTMRFPVHQQITVAFQSTFKNKSHFFSDITTKCLWNFTSKQILMAVMTTKTWIFWRLKFLIVNTELEKHFYWESNQVFYYNRCITPKSVITLRSSSPRHCARAKQLLSKKCCCRGEQLAKLCPIWQAWDLKFRSNAPETNTF